MTDTVEIHLLGVPVDIEARSSAHVDALQREFELIAREQAGPDQVPVRLRRLIADLRDRFGGIVEGPAGEIRRARQEKRSHIDLTYVAPPEVAQACRRLDEMLTEADEYCRSGHLITLATPPELVAFRSWFLGEFIRQTDGQAPRPWTDVAPDGSGSVAGEERASSRATETGTNPEGWNLHGDRDRAVIAFEGELDLESAPHLRTLVAEACQEPLSALEIDLREVTFLDSVGLSVLLAVRLRLDADEVEVTVRSSKAVSRVFQISGVEELFAS